MKREAHGQKRMANDRHLSHTSRFHSGHAASRTSTMGVTPTYSCILHNLEADKTPRGDSSFVPKESVLSILCRVE